jgi:hypothetical protein
VPEQHRFLTGRLPKAATEKIMRHDWDRLVATAVDLRDILL